MISAVSRPGVTCSSYAGRKPARPPAATRSWRTAESRLGVALGNTTADGRVTVEPVYCLGLCSVSPSAMIDGRVVARLDAKKLDALLAEADR